MKTKLLLIVVLALLLVALDVMMYKYPPDFNIVAPINNPISIGFGFNLSERQNSSQNGHWEAGPFHWESMYGLHGQTKALVKTLRYVNK